MTKQLIVDHTMKVANQLPDDKAFEIHNLLNLSCINENLNFTQELQKFTAESHSFDFLNDEEDLYSAFDLIEVFNEQS